MSADNLNSASHRGARSKTDLACDVCRRRKSRCDGKRPSCTHCEISGRSCSYRPTPTNLETDLSVLTRLAHVENRLGLLEERPMHHQLPIVQDPAPPDEVTLDDAKVPDLHTAAGHKVLQYWPRLRVKLTIPGIEPFNFLRAADRQDLSLQGSVSGKFQNFNHALVVQSIERIYERLSELPIAVADLFAVSPYFARQHILESFFETRNKQPFEFDLGACSTEVLLVLTIAATYTAAAMNDSSYPSVETYFKLALQNFWKLHSEPSQYALSLMLCFSQIFLYFFARPFHALGILQSAVPHLAQLGQTRARNEFFDVQIDGFTKIDRFFEAQIESFNRLHFLLESDILTEIDGVPSAKTPQLLRSSATDPHQSGLFSSPQSSNPDTNTTHEYHMRSQLFLRTCLNRVLSSLYTASKAYVHPSEAGIVISDVSRVLDSWYQSLPLDTQFVRNVSSFHLSSQKITARLRELSLRYYACHFILNRPVLYFVVYEDMEKWATPGGSGQGVDPWVFESCRNCVENAALIILSQQAQVQSQPSGYHSWCELQLLVGSYAVLLQVQAVASLAPIFGDVREIDRLLDVAEAVLSQVPFTSLSTTRTLEVLTNIRHNLTVGTPRS